MLFLKATGIVRHVDDLGRIVVPIEIRKNLDIHTGDSVEIFLDDEMIVLKKYMPCCVFCREVEDVIMFKGKLVCKKCIAEMNG